MFARLAKWCFNKRRLVLVFWIVGLLSLNIVGKAVGANYGQDFNLPGTDAGRGLDIINAKFKGVGGALTGTIVFKADQGVDDPAVKAGMEDLFAKTAKMDGITRVESPYDAAGSRFISKNGKIAYAQVDFPQDADFGAASDIKDKILEETPKIPGLEVELGGRVFAAFEQPTTETVGLAFAIIILIFAFGSVLAMGLPVAVALFGIGAGGAMVILFSQFLKVPDFAPFLGGMIGLGVGIDYALLIVTRYREQVHAGHTPEESIAIALDTAGRSVIFAGATVVISLMGMLLMGVTFVQGLSVSASATVAATVLASMTLLPALIGFAQNNIEKTRRAGLIAAGLIALALFFAGFKAAPVLILVPAVLGILTLVGGFFVSFLKAEVKNRPEKPRRETLAYKWSHGIQKRPWTAFLLAAVVLIGLAIPVTSLRLGFSDESNFPKESTTKKAYNLLVEGFGKGYNGTLILVTDVPAGTSLDALTPIQEAIAKDPGVAFVTPAIPNNFVGPATAALWTVAPTTGPQDAATGSLVHRLRDKVLPPVEKATGVDVAVTGFTAGNQDFSHVLGEHLPYFFLAVLGLSFVFLMAVFRSLLVPLKAVVMNMLTIGASYGVVVALFGWGWGGKITGLTPGPIEPWAPMMLFAIVFGLSMDYEVFLLSRMREEWLHTKDTSNSVADGLAATAKVITAAAAIMVVVFGAFLFEQDRTFKLMGTGLSVAILLDATIVRMVLVPATMQLLGDRNWWLPGWLDKILPNIQVEGDEGHRAMEEAYAHDAFDLDPNAKTAPTPAVDPEPVLDVPPATGAAKRAPAKKAVAKKTVAAKKTAAAKKAPATKKAVSKSTAVKKAAAKKAPAKKTAR